MDLIKYIQEEWEVLVLPHPYNIYEMSSSFTKTENGILEFVLWYNENERCVSSLLHEFGHLIIYELYGDKLYVHCTNNRVEEDEAWRWAWAFCMELGLNPLDTF